MVIAAVRPFIGSYSCHSTTARVRSMIGERVEVGVVVVRAADEVRDVHFLDPGVQLGGSRLRPKRPE